MYNSLRQAHLRNTNSEYFRHIWGSRRRVQNPWLRLTIINRVVVSVGDNLWNHSVYWWNLGIVSESGEQGVRNLMDIVGASTSVGYIWLRLWSGGTNHGSWYVAAAAGRKNWPRTNACWWYLAWVQRVGAGVSSGYLVRIDVSWERWCPDQGTVRVTTLWLLSWPVGRLVDLV